MKRVFVTKNPTEAHLVKGLLEREGIAAEVQGEWLYGAMGEIPFTPETWPSVWISKDSQLKRALKFVAGYEGR
jgi:Putative prokaryotic signal transducing protein